MLDLDIEVDTELGQRAIDEVTRYLRDNAAGHYSKEDGWPVARAQIAGLRQIAANEPTKVGEFAEHQRVKTQGKLNATKNEDRQHKLRAEITFWERIRGLCEGQPPKFPWSLNQARDQALPADLQDDKYLPGAQLTNEQHASRKDKRERRERWQRQWMMEHYAAFFQRFCVHYLYEMSKRTTGE